MECTLKSNSNIKRLVEAYDEIVGLQSVNKTKDNKYLLLSEVEYETIKRKQDRQQSNKEY